jgi:hypothetical protein
MRQKSQKKAYRIPLMFRGNITRDVYVKARSREVAEARALKRNSTAMGVKKTDA